MDWKKLVGAVAPALATALGGPLAGVAVKEIGSKLLGKPDADEAAVAAAVAGATPADLIKLKELDHAFAAQMAEAGIKLEEIEAADRANARARQIATKDWVPSALAITVITSFLALLYLMSIHQMPEANRSTFDILLGMLAGAVTSVFSYYFGSSKGSRDKDAVIGRAVK
jgi:hypothetical protein